MAGHPQLCVGHSPTVVVTRAVLNFAKYLYGPICLPINLMMSVLIMQLWLHGAICFKDRFCASKESVMEGVGINLMMSVLIMHLSTLAG